MKKYVIAIVIAFGALFGLSVQAAPLTDNTAAIQEVVQQGATQRVYYRYGWRRGYGWRGYGWRRYGVYGGCRLRCNPWRCWRVCW
jgi:hypothetical protein